MIKNKRIWIIILVVIYSLLQFSCANFINDQYDLGYNLGQNENFRWNYNAVNCNLKIEGIALGDNSFTSDILKNWHKTRVNKVILYGNITALGISAFSEYEFLKSIEIPPSVTTIGESAFEHCKSLSTITIPYSVTTIGESAFERCRSLSTITISYSAITTIGLKTFSCCTSLSSITIPSSVTTIGDSAFYDCESLSSITLTNVESIGSLAFADCKSLSSITLPASCTEVSNQAFDGWTSDQTIILDWSSTDETMRYLDGLNNGNHATIKYADGTPYTAIRY